MRLHRKLAVLVAGLLLPGLASAGQQASKPALPPDPAELVRKTIDNELKPESNGPHFMYRLVKKAPDHIETREMIETEQGVLGRLIAVDGKPLTPQQREKEDKRLQKLVNDPSTLSAKQKSQQEDDARTRKMVKALPDAFLYEYAGTREQAPWGELVVLNFKPNPNFDPPSRETMVYKGMEGTMWIAVPQYRLAKIDAKLFRDVTFGWGILGHLDSGGQFEVEQQPVGGGDWEPTHMVLNFTGKALIFKTIKIRQDQITSDYRIVPKMNVAEAVQLLKKSDGVVVENQSK